MLIRSELKAPIRDALQRAGLLYRARAARSRVTAVRQDWMVRRVISMLEGAYPDRLEARRAHRIYLEGLEAERAGERVTRDRRAILEILVRLGAGAASSLPALAPQDVRDALGRVATAKADGGLGGVTLAALEALLDVPRDKVVEEAAKLAADPGDAAATLRAAQRAAAGSVDVRALVTAVLEQVVDPKLVPHAYEYDFVDDIEPLVGGRYASGSGDVRAAHRVLKALAALVGASSLAALPAALQKVLGPGHAFVPPRGAMNDHAAAIIPDLTEEFTKLRAVDDPSRFLEINREYSARRKAEAGGRLDVGGLSLLLGYDRDLYARVHALVELRRTGKLVPGDEVLVVGPRHANELEFFREQFGLKATGLDLVESPVDNIVVGDMHAMPFESGRFKLVYTCATLSYAYAYRHVMAEMARVTARPGYLLLSDSGDRTAKVDPLGRTDPMNAAAMIGCFYDHRYEVFLRDEGVSPDLAQYFAWPNVGIALL